VHGGGVNAHDCGENSRWMAGVKGAGARFAFGRPWSRGVRQEGRTRGAQSPGAWGSEILRPNAPRWVAG
jgi:hypothetical protein